MHFASAKIQRSCQSPALDCNLARRDRSAHLRNGPWKLPSGKDWMASRRGGTSRLAQQCRNNLRENAPGDRRRWEAPQGRVIELAATGSSVCRTACATKALVIPTGSEMLALRCQPRHLTDSRERGVATAPLVADRSGATGWYPRSPRLSPMQQRRSCAKGKGAGVVRLKEVTTEHRKVKTFTYRNART